MSDQPIQDLTISENAEKENTELEKVLTLEAEVIAAPEVLAEPDEIAEPVATAQPDAGAEPLATAGPVTVTEPGAVAEPGAAAGPETVSGPDAVAGPEAIAEPDAAAGPEAIAEPDAAAGPEPVAEPDAAAGPEPVAGPDAAAGPEAVSEPDAAAGPEAVSEPDAAAGPEPVAGPDAAAGPEAVSEPDAAAGPEPVAGPDAATGPVEAAEEEAEAIQEMPVPVSPVEEVEAEFEDAARGESGVVGYTGEITGKVVKLADLLRDGAGEDDGQIPRSQLTALIESTLTDVSEHDIVPGKVVAVGDKDVVIDIGFKSDGVVAKNEFKEQLEVGTEVEVYLERIEDYHGQLVLSKVKADKMRRWQHIESVFENESVLEGTVIRRIKGGMIVELLDGLEAFLPGSQVDVRPVRDFDAYLERRMEFKIVKINAANENVVVSHKALIQKELAAQRESILSTMEPGQILEGIVKNITDFGVFIDLGGVDGLLHITDLSWGRVTHPSEILGLDVNVKVVVLDYDKQRQRISLGLKQLQPHPWEKIEERYKKGDVVEGKVVSITDYGTFVEIEKGIEGLVHISEMSWTDHIRHPSQKVSLGQIVTVAILNIDHGGKKISLGMKQFEKNPWDGLAERYPPGTVLRGTVRNITTFGVFVEIEPGIDGLVHISDLSWTKKIRHPGELVRKRQELSVVILEIDESRQRISLGHKQIETNPWTGLATVYEEGSDHKAKVLTVDDKGLHVELPLEVEAFVPVGELRNGRPNIFRSYREGDELELRVIRMDVNQKEIVMSELAKERQDARLQRVKEKMEKQEMRDEQDRTMKDYKKREKAASGPTTLGELSGLAALRDQMKEAERSTEDSE